MPARLVFKGSLVGKLGYLIMIFVGVSFFSFGTSISKAQEQNGWSPPIRLSSDSSAASEGFMVADAYGFVHVFWIESGLDDNRSVIQYSRFDGEFWTPPVDIYSTQPGGLIGFLSPVIDHMGQIHLVWTGGFTGQIFYATASTNEAISAQNWSKPISIDLPADQVRLQIDSNGVMHLVYANAFGGQPGVFYIRSNDEAITWSNPIKLDPDIPSNYQPNWLQFDLGENDGLHVVWHYIEFGELGKEVRYMHSLDGGDNWSIPISIDEPDQEPGELRMAHPGLIAEGKSIFIIWAGDQQLHREYRISTDSGGSWSDPKRMLGNLVGQAAGAGLAVDSGGRVHYATQVRYPVAIWHTVWDQGPWSAPSMAYFIQQDAFSPVGDRIRAHNVRLAVRSGNQLVMTFTSSPGDGPLELYAMHRTLEDVSSTVPMPTPTMISSSHISPDLPQPSLPKISTPTAVLVDHSLIGNPLESNSVSLGNRLWLGIYPALAMILIVIVVQQLRKH
jgi:hypothetical protein